jgi:DNA-directed RNA polymerase subunit M/transcription elongation factor TFIIS
MGYTMPMTEGGSPLPLSGYTTNWPIEMFMGYTIEDLIQKFGYRIQNAIRTPRYCGKTGLHIETMKNKTKWWKFWNNDIRKDYKWYTGQVYNDEDIKFSNYINNPNPTVPPSEVFPTLAPEHPEKSAVKIKLPSPRMKKTSENPYGLLDHSFKQKLIIPLKKRKSGKSYVNEAFVMSKKLNDDITPGIIYAPFVLQTRTEPNPDYDKFMKKYHRDHSRCPNCGSNKMKTTLMGYPLHMDRKEDYKDLNSVSCEKCGYRGKRHDLVPKKRKPRLHEHSFELDGGPCLKCGKTVSEMINEDITNYNKKHGKSK